MFQIFPSTQTEQNLGHFIPNRREVKLQGLVTGGDRPTEVAPPAADPDIGLIHPPGTGLPIRYLPVPPCLLVQLRGVFLDPAVRIVV